MGFLAIALVVATANVVDTSGAWRSSDDDKPAYAAADFDDSAWKTAALPARTAAPPASDAPVLWYRREIAAPPSSGLALGVGVIPSAYEVFVDGERVGANGDVERHVEGTLAPRTFAIPPHALDDGHAVLALRVWMDPDFARAAPLAKRASAGPWLVGDARLVEAEVALGTARLETSRSWERFLAFALFGVALYHLFLWALRRDLYAWLSYSFTVLLLAGWTLLLAVRGDSAMISWTLGPFLGGLAGVPFVELVFRFLDGKAPPRNFRIAQVMLAVSAFGCLLPGRAGLLVAGSPFGLVQ